MLRERPDKSNLREKVSISSESQGTAHCWGKSKQWELKTASHVTSTAESSESVFTPVLNSHSHAFQICMGMVSPIVDRSSHLSYHRHDNHTHALACAHTQASTHAHTRPPALRNSSLILSSQMTLDCVQLTTKAASFHADSIPLLDCSCLYWFYIFFSWFRINLIMQSRIPNLMAGLRPDLSVLRGAMPLWFTFQVLCPSP